MAKARNNPAFCRFREVGSWLIFSPPLKKSEMSVFGNKNVHEFALIVPIFALKSRVDFSQPKYIGRLKSTLLTGEGASSPHPDLPHPGKESIWLLLGFTRPTDYKLVIITYL